MQNSEFTLLSLDDNPPSKSPVKKTSLTTSPSLWNTREFYIYYAFFAVVVPYMLLVGYRLGDANSPKYPRFQSLLSDGWIFGRKVDNSDAQYAGFRNNLPTLTILAVVYLFLSHLFKFLVPTPFHNRRSTIYRAYFFLPASLLAISVIHGANIIKILVIVFISFFIGRITRGSLWNPLLTWCFNLGILFLNDMYKGYKFSSLGSEFAWLDLHVGILSRWYILFNFVMLRLISYNMDYYWQFKAPKNNQIDDRINDEEMTDKERITTPCNTSDYNIVYFLTYVFYLPLYLCGPIVTFNDFISQLRYPSSKITLRTVGLYAFRLIGVILVMELTLHYIYVVAISKALAWDGDTPFELSMIGYFNLLIIWMKLLIPWRFFRLWALADGVWPEENMIRCMSNNFSAQRFWKSWHRSFNRWTIRYIFVPLGGSKYMMFNMWVVFTFVALWHDIEMKLLAWGWLICLFLLPELLATRIFTFQKYGNKPYYRFVCGVGAVFNIMMMMAANLVGFSIGLDGLKDMVSGMFQTSQGFLFLIIASVCMYVGAQVMFEIREAEKRRGDPRWKILFRALELRLLDYKGI
ncbi:MBOAT, membrane-bound O-acyltransferase family-domain-containing protein [Phycomyces nitens]|nr:MBOAT, membrane-bound O-acyltransferase family-domain-containing protein [Phycomyces nitens]